MAMVDVDGSCHFLLADLQSKSVGFGLRASGHLGAESAFIK